MVLCFRCFLIKSSNLSHIEIRSAKWIIKFSCIFHQLTALLVFPHPISPSLEDNWHILPYCPYICTEWHVVLDFLMFPCIKALFCLSLDGFYCWLFPRWFCALCKSPQWSVSRRRVSERWNQHNYENAKPQDLGCVEWSVYKCKDICLIKAFTIWSYDAFTFISIGWPQITTFKPFIVWVCDDKYLVFSCSVKLECFGKFARILFKVSGGLVRALLRSMLVNSQPLLQGV